jgi:hypothetical protein
MANGQLQDSPELTPSNGSPATESSFHPSPRPPAVDADPDSRPGVPFIGQSDLIPPPLDRQAPSVEVLVGPERNRLTPVFGTSTPPRGLSGVIRRAAYRIPEHKAPRWMLLVLGDRVDVWEHRIQRHPVLAATALIGLVWLGVARARR